VLVVEADDRMRRFIGKALGDVVVDARNGPRALTLLATGLPFDVVVLGCVPFGKRPDHAACVHLVRRVFQLCPWLPIVVLSDARPPGRLMAQVLASGVHDCLPRNVTVASLARSIARVGRRHGTRPPGAGSVATVKRIFAFLEQHVGEIVGLHDLAAMAQMSRSHFSRTFHAVAGMSLRHYVRDLRLKRAQELLVASRLSLTSVAVESGFYDLPHFDKAFRQRLGMSPQQFRIRH